MLRASTGQTRSYTMRNLSSWLFACAVLCGLPTMVPAVDAGSNQIRALIAEKTSRTPAQQKMESALVLELRRQRGELAGLSHLRSSVRRDAYGRAAVEIWGEVTPDLLRFIRAAGGAVRSSHPRFGSVVADVPLESLESVAERTEVRVIRTAYAPRLNQINVSEGDVAHAADQARSALGIDGSGVRVGVISDSVDALADLQSSGDLPLSVSVLPGQSGNPGTSEGTAMLEIVHDSAPGSDLFFATGVGGQAQFAQNILDLAAAGCDIIVDDLGYFTEPVFQDGVIAQAVNQVAGDDVLYFSAAGNAGNVDAGTAGVFEGDYTAAVLPPPLTGTGQSALNFGGGDSGNEVTLDPPAVITLQWANPFGEADDDYDLFLLDSTLTNVLAASTDTQNGTQDPIELIDSGAVDDTGNVLVVVKFSGANRYVHLNSHRGQLEHATDGQIFGHPAATGAFAVAAANVSNAGGGVFTGGPANPAEPFTSDGPRRIFFDDDGSPVSAFADGVTRGGQSFIERDKPDITAADGVSTATPGFDPFFGTSAAAPTAAAGAALLLELRSTVTPSSLLGAYEDESLDIEAPGYDLVSGFGIVLIPDAATAFVPDIRVSPESGLITSEDGMNTAEFTLVLNAEPTDDVQLDLTPTSNVSINPSSVTFTAVNFDQPRTINVTAIDDAVDNGDQPFTIATAPAISDDDGYDGLNPNDVSGLVTDDDVAGILVVGSNLMVSESGATAGITFHLDSQPTEMVGVMVTSSDPTEALISLNATDYFEQIMVMFTPSTWDTPRTLTVQGQDDAIVDGDQAFTILTSATMSSDDLYDGLPVPDIGGTNTDDADSAGVLASRTTLVTDDDGGTDSFTLVLTSQPEADTVVDITSQDPTQGLVSANDSGFAASAALTFTPQTWDLPQTVVVQGQGTPEKSSPTLSGASSKGGGVYMLTITISGGDSTYLSLPPGALPNITVTNIDTDDIVFFDGFEQPQ